MTQIWYVTWQRAPSEREQQALYALLPPQRRARLDRTGDPAQRAQALCAYGLLRLALRRYAGLGTLSAIALTERGKPYFPDLPDLHFSLSHTEGAALVGISDRPVGVDIEKKRPLGRRVKERLGAGLSEEAALRRWTALEAQAKRSGKGVGEFLHRDIAEEHCISLEVGEGYYASAACQGALTVRECAVEDMIGSFMEEMKDGGLEYKS